MLAAPGQPPGDMRVGSRGRVMESNDEGVYRRQQWESGTSALLTIGSGVFLLAFSVLVLAPELAPLWRGLLTLLLGAVWVAFIVDLCVRLALTPRGARRQFLRSNKTDAASAVLPLVRPFALLKYLPRLRWFRGTSGNSIRSRFVASALAYTVLFVYVIALSVLAVERNAPGATIVSFGDAVWWACVTVATVGYGDFAPITAIGRVLAVVLMAGGVAIIAATSATVVSYLTERIARAHQQLDGNTGNSPDSASGEA